MLLRSIRAHLPSALTTFVLAFAVSAGAVAVVGAARVGGTPGAVAGMLALYGAVALAEQAARSVSDRSHDVALARLRGLSGVRLVAFAAAPLLAITLVGVGTGALAGVGLAHRVAAGWDVPYALETREVLVAVAILAGAWGTVTLVASMVIRRPLVESLAVHTRRHPSSWVTTFLELLVVAAAGLAVYEAHRSEASWAPAIAPALVALAAGQLVMWLLVLTPRLGRRPGLALTTRRLRRDPAPASVVRILVGAAVLLAVTLTGARAAADWRDEAGRLRAGGPLAVPVDAGGLRAYAASHDADPDGRWLMAAVAVDDIDPARRRVFVDTHRWDAVVGDFFASTSLGSARTHLAPLTAQPGPVLVRADRVAVEVAAIGAGTTGDVGVTFVSDQGYPRTTRLHVRHTGRTTARLGPCAVGCSVLSVELAGAPFQLAGVSAGGFRVLAAVSHTRGAQRVPTLGQDAPSEAVLRTPGLRPRGSLDGMDGLANAVRPAGTLPALPLVGRSGWLLDLGRELRGSVGTVPSGRAYVLARADTPATVLARLHRDGGGTPTAYSVVAGRLAHTPQARADSLALLVAVGVALVALTHLLAWLSGQMGRRRAEVASLRTAGVRPEAVRQAYAVEAVVLATVVLVAASVAAVATTVPLLTPMHLVGGWGPAPVLLPRIRPLTLAVVVLAVAVSTAVVCTVVFTRFGRGARPAALRAADR